MKSLKQRVNSFSSWNTAKTANYSTTLYLTNDSMKKLPSECTNS